MFVFVTERAVVARINRRLQRDEGPLADVLRKSRGQAALLELGEYYLHSTQYNAIVGKNVDPEAMAREMGLLHPGEHVAVIQKELLKAFKAVRPAMQALVKQSEEWARQWTTKSRRPLSDAAMAQQLMASGLTADETRTALINLGVSREKAWKALRWKK